MAKVYIGTSGWLYHHWSFDYAPLGLSSGRRQDKLGKSYYFYPAGLPQVKWLEFYGKNFKTVEVNSSFYHSMRREVYEGWVRKVPPDFIFSVKASRFITHIKRLLDCKEPLKRLLEQADGLGEKLGVILFQLPPRWKANKERLESFLQTADRLRTTAVVGSKKAVVKYAFEFRDESWLSDNILAILKKYRVALCIQDSPNWPSKEVITSDFVYLRFHGGRFLYASEYAKKELESWAKKIKKWQKLGLDVFAYFNNDAHGYAIENAKTLEFMIVGREG